MRAVVAHLFFGLAVQEIVDQLEGVLQFAGVVGGEPRPQNREEHHDDQRHQQLHGDEIGPGPRGSCVHADDVQNAIANAGKIIVEELSDPEFTFRAYTSSKQISTMTAATDTNRPDQGGRQTDCRIFQYNIGPTTQQYVAQSGEHGHALSGRGANAAKRRRRSASASGN